MALETYGSWGEGIENSWKNNNVFVFGCDYNGKMGEGFDVFCYIFVLLKNVESRVI